MLGSRSSAPKSGGCREGEDIEAFVCLPNAAEGLGGDAVEVPRREQLPAPWTGVRFIEVRPSAYALRFHAALRTAEGWYVLHDVAVLGRGASDTVERATRLAVVVEELVGGGAAELVIEVETRWSQTEGGEELASERHEVEFLCGVGPSGGPSCTGALPRATEASRRGTQGIESTRWSVMRRTEAAGALVLEGEAEGLDEPAAALLGEHPLRFP